MSVTIRDVAKAARVSARTVSRVINGEAHVHARTHKRIMDAIEQLKYRPNINALNLVRRSTRRIGVILPDSRNPVYSEIAEALDARARAQGYDCFILHSEGQAEREARFLNLVLDRTVDGLVVFPNFLDANREIYRHLIHEKLPLVLRGRPSDFEDDLDYVTVDTDHGGFLATRHLLSLGHRQVGILVSEFALGRSYGRLRGYERAHAQFGLPVQPDLQVHCGHQIEDGYHAMRRLISARPDVTAIFCHNDHLAMACFRAARESGRRIPDDLAVVGFDDIALSRFCEVPLTTVNHPKETEGRLLADAICGRIESPDLPPHHVTLKPELVIRESCGYGLMRTGQA